MILWFLCVVLWFVVSCGLRRLWLVAVRVLCFVSSENWVLMLDLSAGSRIKRKVAMRT